MSKAVGWALIIFLVVVLGTHPSALAGLVHEAAGVLHRAGNELSSFLAKL